MPLSLVIMGVAGCGKTLVGEALHSSIGLTFVDGDSLHPPANIQKMSAGIPLQDADRWPWLTLVGQRIGASSAPMAIGCSALKRSYRDHIRLAADERIGFVYLAGERSVIEKRMQARQGHFMPTSLLDSQFATLEPLQDDEFGITINIDQPPARIVDSVRRFCFP